ncbi:hypothetical protein CLAM6_32430 [Cobetia sp. AM6]|nr:hypothetical protein CLAM6_32430 [Cobetia sp. AM6]
MVETIGLTIGPTMSLMAWSMPSARAELAAMRAAIAAAQGARERNRLMRGNLEKRIVVIVWCESLQAAGAGGACLRERW